MSHRPTDEPPRTIRHGSLSRYLIALVLRYVLALSIPITAVNVWVSYREETARQEQQIRAVMSLFGLQLRQALWDFDEPTVRKVLDGLSHFPALHTVEVRAPDLHARYIKPNAGPAQTDPPRHYALESPDGSMVIGEVRLGLDPSYLRAAVWEAVGRTLLLLGAELVLLAVVIFMLVERSVTKPVLALARHVRDMTPARLGDPAPLPSGERADELQSLANGVTALQQALKEQLSQRDAIAQTLQESEARLQLMTDSIPNQVWAANPDGTLDYVSRRVTEYFGLPAERMLGASWQEAVHPDDLQECLERWSDSLRTGAPYQMDFRLRRHDGQYLWHTALALPRRDASSKIVRWFGSNTDISERKRHEQELLQSQKLKAIGHLAGGVAHDFNNQLTAILGNAELLASKCQEPEEKQLTDSILSAGNRCRDLTKNLLTFSRKSHLQWQKVDVHALIAETVALIERSVDKRIRVRRTLHASSAVVQGDPSQLQNALLNVALNARDAMPDGGELAFATEVVHTTSPPLDDSSTTVLERVARPTSYLRVSVRDTGTGMDAEVKQHLFEPFFTTKPPGKGTGMGLASVYGTVQSHYGWVSVESELGKGTTLLLHLPLAAPQSEEDAVPEYATSQAPLRVLVVDDEPGVRQSLQWSLEDAGHGVQVAATGEEGVKLFEREHEHVDLVILDAMMPGMSGLETLQALKRVDSHVRVLLCSGFGPEGEIKRILDQGASAFLQKPYRQGQLTAAIDQAMRAR